MNREEVIIELYLKIEAACRSILKGDRLRICGRPPGLSEAEVLTIEIFGELQGHHTDAAIFSYTQAHWRAWFPKLGSYKALVKQCANLVGLKQALFAQVFAPKGDCQSVTRSAISLPPAHQFWRESAGPHVRCGLRPWRPIQPQHTCLHASGRA